MQRTVRAQWARGLTALMTVAATASCGPAAEYTLDTTSALSGEGKRAQAIRAAAKAEGVPEALLVAWAWQVGRLGEAQLAVPLEQHGGHVGEERFGLWQLTQEQVQRAAQLTRLSEAEIKSDTVANARAAAALVRAQAGAGEVSWEQWARAISQVHGVGDPALAAELERDVLITVGDGLEVAMEDGERLTLSSQPMPELPELATAELTQELTAPGEYPPMKWLAAHPNNYVAGRNGGAVRYVIVHMTEGTYYSTLSWFSQANPYQSSTHYVIKSSNGEITQMVNEANGAWHAGNNHYSMNSIGIEHEGFTSNLSGWFTEAMYQSSARLVCAIARRHKIPVDRQHIIGHFQVPNPKRLAAWAAPATDAQWWANRWNYGGASNHFDPSYGTTAWKWDEYLQRIRDCVNGTATPQKPQNPITCSGSACWPGNDLTVGDNGTRVYSLQTGLVYLGHLDAQVALSGAGTFGPATRAAVSALQTRAGLSATGYYDAKTAAALGAALKAKPPDVPAQNLWIGASGPAVTTLQKKLAAIGYSIPATGYYGEITRSTVRKFQTDHKLPIADGSYGPLTRMAMAAHFARGF